MTLRDITLTNIFIYSEKDGKEEGLGGEVEDLGGSKALVIGI